MSRSADVIVVGAGVQGASLAFHLARRGARVLVVERGAIAGEATGRSSGFVRMHYDLTAEAALAWLSFPYFEDWAAHVGAGDPAFVRTGFLEVVPPELLGAVHGNVANQRAIGIDTQVVTPAEIAELVPGIVLDGLAAGAYEPRSGYADPTSTANGFLEAARSLGAEVITGCIASRVVVDGGRAAGVETDRGTFVGGAVAIVAGAWSAVLAATAGVDLPVTPWRHETGYFGLPAGAPHSPVVLDDVGGVYWRPEGKELLLVGLHAGNELGGSPDRPLQPMRQAIVEDMTTRLVRRLPWMEAGTFRTGHSGQDGITPDQRAILGAAGPEGLFLACGFSGTGFKTAPAIGAAMAELILDGRTTTADISIFDPGRFAAGRPIEGEHPYEALWR
ncbi:MAG: FAD-binding oxidoreductase [Chloroflexota bacterium]